MRGVPRLLPGSSWLLCSLSDSTPRFTNEVNEFGEGRHAWLKERREWHGSAAGLCTQQGVCDGAENLKLGIVLGTFLIAVVMYLRKTA